MMMVEKNQRRLGSASAHGLSDNYHTNTYLILKNKVNTTREGGVVLQVCKQDAAQAFFSTASRASLTASFGDSQD
jgi:hypothetical protein